MWATVPSRLSFEKASSLQWVIRTHVTIAIRRAEGHVTADGHAYHHTTSMSRCLSRLNTTGINRTSHRQRVRKICRYILH